MLCGLAGRRRAMAGRQLDVVRDDPAVWPRPGHGREVDAEGRRHPPGVGRRQDTAGVAVSRTVDAVSGVLALVRRAIAAFVGVEEEGDALTAPVGTAYFGDSVDPSGRGCLNL